MTEPYRYDNPAYDDNPGYEDDPHEDQDSNQGGHDINRDDEELNRLY